MSRIRVINEISVPRDSRVLEKLRKAARAATARARETFLIFKQNPFDSRLGSHKIQKLSARYSRVIYAAEIEANLRVVFYIERNTIVTVDIGSHDLYR
jgi:mRNA-degrading endonuclease YafQ of YafQ-DinJ toxin-antitoxin module